MLAPFSAIVPVYNETPILVEAVEGMVKGLQALAVPFELLVCENGSTDGSAEIVDRLAIAHPEVTALHLPAPDYGLALKQGIASCRYPLVVVYNLDFWDLDFTRRAVEGLHDYDVVLGSKAMTGARDERPWLRRLITRSFNAFLRAVFGFTGTDTHGMKAFRQAPAAGLANECVTASWIFDTEFVLRAQRQGLRILEIPVAIQEVRAPGYLSIARRVPRVLRGLLALWRALGRRPPRAADAPRFDVPSTDGLTDGTAEAPVLRHDRRPV